MDGVNCLNPWDVQCKHIVTPDGISESLCAGEKRWGSLPPNVCYEVQMDVMGVDCYNLCGTGSIGRTLATSSGGLNEHIPVVCHEVQMDVIGFDAYQHHNWRESETVGPLTTSSCATVRGDTPLIVLSYDGYNMSVNDKTFMTITSGATDDHHVPSVIYSLEGNGSRPHIKALGIQKMEGCSL